MGKDIHMFIVGKQGIIKSNIYTGRNYVWFDQLTDAGDYADDYANLPITFGWSPFTPEILKIRYSRERDYYDHYHFKVKYFVEWFEKYRPNVDAGWVTTYDKWLYETKGIIPHLTHELSERTSEDDFYPQDWHFIEVEKPDDCSKWLYDYIKENNIDGNADVTYCFDW